MRPAVGLNHGRRGPKPRSLGAFSKDTSLLAELGAWTFRQSSPNTRHEDVESHVGENFTREKLMRV